MKLRHKKPLNPYKGQTNNDKNEFNDDDFRQQGSLHKKNGIAPTDQIFKYAKILNKFIKTINQDYRLAAGQSQLAYLNASSESSQQKLGVKTQLERQTVFGRKQQLKQQKQITKLQNKIELKEEKKQYTLSSRRREAQTTTNPKKEAKSPNPKEWINSNASITSAPRSNKFQQETKKNKVTSQKIEQSKANNEANIGIIEQSIKPNVNPVSIARPLMNQIPNLMPNFQNIMNLPPLPPNFQALMSPNQFLGNLNLMNMNGLGNINPIQLGQIIMRNYNPNFMYGGIPVGINMNNLNMMGLGMAGVSNNPQFLLAQNRNNMQPVPNLFQQQLSNVKKVEQNPTSAPKDTSSVYPLKRAAFHIAIAYKIYLDKLKHQGRSIENLEDIDPTKNARRVKTNQQKNQLKNAKDISKRKK